jgi:hypothetical protein
MCLILLVNHRLTPPAYHEPRLGGGAGRANHAAPSCSGSASLRPTKPGEGRTSASAASSSHGRQPMAVLKCARLTPSPKVDQHQERGFVDARGNGGEARTPGDPSAPSRAMSARASSNREIRSPRSRHRPTVHRNGGGSLVVLRGLRGLPRFDLLALTRDGVAPKRSAAALISLLRTSLRD